MSFPDLQLVSDGEVPADAPSYGQALALLAEQADEIAGQETTIKQQARHIGRLEREVERYAKAEEHHPRSKEILDLIDRWRIGTEHPKAKASKDRIDVIKARLKDGYSIEQIALALDGIAAFPFVRNGQRVAEGSPSQRHDSLSLALKGGENLERFAVLGYQARKARAA